MLSNTTLLNNRKFVFPMATIVVLLLIDQLIKTYIKGHFMLGEIRPIFGDWFKLYFIENDGMAYGMKLFGGGKVGKLVLTFFRLVVSGFGFWYLIKCIRNNANWGLLICIALVLAGAMGNIIDSVFYGVVYADTNHYVGGWFEGQVVDMFYAPMWEGHLPEWLPIWGGQFFVFFSPIWNFADACITVGVAIMVVGQNTFFSKEEVEKAFQTHTSNPTPEDSDATQ
jgi:signal peptidase II